MLSENLAGDVNRVRLWQIGRMEVGAVLVGESDVEVVFPGPRIRKPKEEEDDAAHLVE
jgi:hypothetical protein